MVLKGDESSSDVANDYEENGEGNLKKYVENETQNTRNMWTYKILQTKYGKNKHHSCSPDVVNNYLRDGERALEETCGMILQNSLRITTTTHPQ